MEHEPDDDRHMLRSTRLPPMTPPAPPSSLDDHEARRQELRTALEELKADLDGRVAPPARSGSTSSPATPSAPTSAVATPAAAASRMTATAPASAPTPVPPATAAGSSGPGSSWPLPGRHLALAALAAVAVLGAVVGIVHVVAWSVAGARDVASSGSSTTSTSGSAPSSTSATPSPSTSGPPVATAPAPGGIALQLPPGLPRSGPGADVPGAEVTAVVGRSGRLVVYERLVVRPGTTSVYLAPTAALELPSGLREAGSGVTGLQVAADGHAVTPTADGAGWRVEPGAGAFTRLTIRYQLARGLVRAAPAPPGRATLVLRPLTGPEASRAHDPVVVRLLDTRVGQVYCPAAPQPMCDSSRGALHVATVPAGARPVVLAQVTLR